MKATTTNRENSWYCYVCEKRTRGEIDPLNALIYCPKCYYYFGLPEYGRPRAYSREPLK